MCEFIVSFLNIFIKKLDAGQHQYFAGQATGKGKGDE
jgi:hypothetical protein